MQREVTPAMEDETFQLALPGLVSDDKRPAAVNTIPVALIFDMDMELFNDPCELSVVVPTATVQPFAQELLTGAIVTLALRFSASERANVKSLISSDAVDFALMVPTILWKDGAATAANMATMAMTTSISTRVNPLLIATICRLITNMFQYLRRIYCRSDLCGDIRMYRFAGHSVVWRLL
jgi:hypothetical protein